MIKEHANNTDFKTDILYRTLAFLNAEVMLLLTQISAIHGIITPHIQFHHFFSSAQLIVYKHSDPLPQKNKHWF